MSGNLGQDLTIVGKIPVVKDIISTLKGDKSSDMSIASAESISNAYKIGKETYQLDIYVNRKSENVCRLETSH